MTGPFRYDGSRCECGAVFVTTVERCSRCGRWDPAPVPIEAGGMLIATTQVTGDDGAVRSFGMVDLGCGLRIIGLMDPNLPLGTEVVAWSEVNGVATFVSVTQAPPLSRHEAVTA